MSWPADSIYGEWPRSNFLARPILQRRMTTFMRDFRNVLRALRTPWPGVLDAAKRVRVESIFSTALQVTASSSIESLGGLLGVARSARLAVLVERRRRGAGRPPRSLAEIQEASGGSLPMDPFSGDALLFKLEDRSYVIYSIGSNGKDDGGAVETDDQDRRLDIGVRVRLR